MTSSSNPTGSIGDSQPTSRTKSACPWAEGFPNTTPSEGVTYPCALADGGLRKIDTASTAITRTQVRMESPLEARRGWQKQWSCLMRSSDFSPQRRRLRIAQRVPQFHIGPKRLIGNLSGLDLDRNLHPSKRIWRDDNARAGELHRPAAEPLLVAPAGAEGERDQIGEPHEWIVGREIL